MRGFEIRTQEDVDAYYRRQGFAPLKHGPGSVRESVVATATPEPVPKPGRKVSKTEQRYAPLLDLAKHEGRIKAWWPCPLRLWIAPRMSYTADYLTQASGPDVLTFAASQPITLNPAFAESLCRFGSYSLTLVEVKHTFMHDKRRALDRLKTAASLYPMIRFTLATWDSKRQEFIEKDIPAL